MTATSDLDRQIEDLEKQIAEEPDGLMLETLEDKLYELEQQRSRLTLSWSRSGRLIGTVA